MNAFYRQIRNKKKRIVSFRHWNLWAVRFNQWYRKKKTITQTNCFQLRQAQLFLHLNLLTIWNFYLTNWFYLHSHSKFQYDKWAKYYPRITSSLISKHKNFFFILMNFFPVLILCVCFFSLWIWKRLALCTVFLVCVEQRRWLFSPAYNLSTKHWISDGHIGFSWFPFVLFSHHLLFHFGSNTCKLNVMVALCYAKWLAKYYHRQHQF